MAPKTHCSYCSADYSLWKPVSIITLCYCVIFFFFFDYYFLPFSSANRLHEVVPAQRLPYDYIFINIIYYNDSFFFFPRYQTYTPRGRPSARHLPVTWPGNPFARTQTHTSIPPSHTNN